jgi:hypothetical protein
MGKGTRCQQSPIMPPVSATWRYHSKANDHAGKRFCGRWPALASRNWMKAGHGKEGEVDRHGMLR